MLGVAESFGSDGQGIRPKLDSVTSSAETHTKVELPEHVKDLWLQSCKHLNQDQSERLARVLLEFADQFSKDDLDLGCFAGADHKIDIGVSNQIRQKMCRTPAGFEDEEKQHLDGLLNIGVIQPSSSKWASPPVLIRKKEGKVR